MVILEIDPPYLVTLLPVNVIPPAGDVDDGDSTAALAALALLSLAALAHTRACAGSKRSKRASALTTPAPPQRKKTRLETSAGAVAGAREAAAAQGHH
jgi:hypothetical protein